MVFSKRVGTKICIASYCDVEQNSVEMETHLHSLWKKIESHSRFFFPFRFKELEVICVIFVFLPICIFSFRLPICIINPLMRPAHQSNIFLSHLILLSIRFGCFISFKRKIWKLFIFFFSFRFNSWTGNACSYFDFISFRSLNSSSYLSFSISTFHFRYFLLI